MKRSQTSRHPILSIGALVALVALLALWVLNVSRPGSRVEGRLNGCVAPPSAEDHVLRVISFNMLHGIPQFTDLRERLEIIAAEIDRLDADIVILQEVPWTVKTGAAAQDLAERTGMNYAYLRSNANRWALLFEEGEAILSRYPLSDPGFAELQPRAGFFEHRVVLHVTAATPGGDVDVYGTHLTNGDPNVNLGQARALADLVEQSRSAPAVIVGDFNARPDSPQIQALQERWLDAFAEIEPADAYTCCIDDLTVEEAIPTRRIDYVFLAAGDKTLDVVAVQRVFDRPFTVPQGWQWASDHIGLMVDLILEP